MSNIHTISDVRFVSSSVNATAKRFDAVIGRVDRGASLRKHLGKRLHLGCCPGLLQAESGQPSDQRYLPLSGSLAESWRMSRSVRPNPAPALATAQPPAPAWAALILNRVSAN